VQEVDPEWSSIDVHERVMDACGEGSIAVTSCDGVAWVSTCRLQTTLLWT